MRPVVLLVLLLVATNPESAAPKENTGLSFVVVFPENIAFYYPEESQNQVHVTALYDDTEVAVKSYTYQTTPATLHAGETRIFTIDQKMELRKSQISNETLQITSTKSVTVQAVSRRHNSVQTALVLPSDQLGTEYLIPPVPQIQGTTAPEDMVTSSVTERGPFRLIVVNTDQPNKVTLEGAESVAVSLEPYQSAQIMVDTGDTLRAVKTEQPAAVLFGHTCAIKYNCTCGMLYTLLPPPQTLKSKFFVPPVTDLEEETFLLLSGEGSTKVEVFDPDSPVVETTGTAILYRPGLLLALIPEADFAPCYAINLIPDMENSAVILVHKDLKGGVRIGSLPPEDPAWQPLTGTDYVSTTIVLTAGKNVIWHNSANIGVYFVGKKDNTLFGNPAAVVSKTADYRGCLLSPEVVEIGQTAGGWPESLKYCRNNNLELVSFPTARLQTQIYPKIHEAKEESLQEVWIGMRRSSLTGEWYWLSKDPVNDTDWEDGEPGGVQDGQCVTMSLTSGHDFKWTDKDCCKAVHPVCYRHPVLFPM